MDTWYLLVIHGLFKSTAIDSQLCYSRHKEGDCKILWEFLEQVLNKNTSIFLMEVTQWSFKISQKVSHDRQAFEICIIYVITMVI